MLDAEFGFALDRLDFFGTFAIKHEDLADMLHRRGRELSAELIQQRDSGIAVFAEDANLDQLVRQQAALDFL
jgi:hypothetical protein